MTAVILDDERYCTETLYHLLKKHCPQVTRMEMYTDPIVALEYVRQHPPDIIFLDVDMPHMSGFDFLNALNSSSSSIIFTTAYDTYAVQAFKVNAIDYLLKPIDKTDLVNAVNKVIKRPQPLDEALVSGLIRSAIAQNQVPKRISIHTADGIYLLATDDILYCKSDGAYSYLYLKSQPAIMVSKNLSEMEDLIKSASFFRIHKSYLINIDHILKVNKSEGGEVMMSNEERIPISRQKRLAFFQLLSQP